MRVGLLWLLKVGLGGLLLYAGILKWIDPSQFAEEIANYRLLPALAPTLAVVLPPIECVLGLVLVLAPARTPWLPAAAAGAGLLLMVFTVGVIQVVVRGIDISCGCFGGGSGAVTELTVARNVVLVLAAAVVVWLSMTEALRRDS